MLQKWPAKLKKVKKVITSGKEQKAKDIIFLFLLGGDNINQG
jgi:glutamate synthase domain-containing protein 2